MHFQIIQWHLSCSLVFKSIIFFSNGLEKENYFSFNRKYYITAFKKKLGGTISVSNKRVSF